jgi:hypothetical protein
MAHPADVMMNPILDLKFSLFSIIFDFIIENGFYHQLILWKAVGSAFEGFRYSVE